MVGYALRRVELETMAALRALACTRNMNGSCHVAVYRYQLGLQLECYHGNICASKRLDWALMLACHDPKALFDYHIAKLAAEPRSTT